jgi:xanthine dehydrogenase accessory factor
VIATTPIDVLKAALAKANSGRDCVIVTLVGIEGSSSRAIGTQMMVGGDGDVVGSFSGGCIEAAVREEALSVLEAGAGRIVRYGSGSPYIDIRLPCGGGIDLLFSPRPEAAMLALALKRLGNRETVRIAFDERGLVDLKEESATGWQNDRFVVPYFPPLRIVAVGQGEDLTAFARLASRFGTDVLALTPDCDAVELLEGEGIGTLPLIARTQWPDVDTDPWTAIVFLFHDHDWEEALLPKALAMPAFYHGAIGSIRTHRARMAALTAAGVAQSGLDRLRGMIGVIPATRDPATLALSVLGEIVAEYQLTAASLRHGALPVTTPR